MLWGKIGPSAVLRAGMARTLADLNDPGVLATNASPHDRMAATAKMLLPSVGGSMLILLDDCRRRATHHFASFASGPGG